MKIKELTKLNQHFLQFIFPAKCAVCGEILGSEKIICTKCDQQIFKNYPDNHNKNLIVLYEYTEKMKSFIAGIKYKKDLRLLSLASEKIIKNLSFFQKPDMIIPVPLHPLRETERGFNQALELIKKFAQFHKIPIGNDLVFRKHHTQRSYLLEKKARAKQAETAFGLWQNKEVLIKGKHLLLFDDIITTGSTTAAIEKILNSAGAKKVTICCFAGVP